jgi:hypothetical protein
VSFEAALAEHPAPTRLGDISLRYEPSMLIGETSAPGRTLRPTLAWAVGLLTLVLTLGLFLLDAPMVALWLSVGASAACLAVATRLEAWERRRRRFVANFATTSLRLDFSQPISGRARTLVVHFDDVKAVDLVRQADGAHCLTVDFAPDPGPELLREVLAAYIEGHELEQAHRLLRVLEGAFGLGAPPADSPAFDVPGVDPPMT